MTFVEKLEADGIVELTFRTEVDVKAMVPYSQFMIPGPSPDVAVEALKEQVQSFCRRNRIKIRNGVEYIQAVDHYTYILHTFKIC
jgi:hypothetical protein